MSLTDLQKFEHCLKLGQTPKEAADTVISFTECRELFKQFFDFPEGNTDENTSTTRS